MNKYLLIISIFFMAVQLEAVTLKTARARSFIGAASVSDYVMDGTYLNPASLSLKGVFAYGVGYTDGYRGDADHEKTFYGWVADSLNGSFDTEELLHTRADLMSVRGFPLSASLSYVKAKTTGAVPLRYGSYGLSLAKNIDKTWAWGLSINAVDGEERSGAGSSFFWTGGIGVVYRWSKLLTLGLSGSDLFETGSDVKPGELRRDPKAQLGLSFKFREFFQIFTDLNYNFEIEKLYIVGALESKVNSYTSFRLSLGYDEVIEDFKIGTGLSFLGPKLQLHYGVAFDLESKSALHSVDFSLPL